MRQFDTKIVTWKEAASRVRKWKSAGENVAFTNGCFDILHKGHITYLQEARSLASRLVVGVNSDHSTRRLKGEGRPINDENARAAVLAALESVDLVVIFDQDTPKELIGTVDPDILVKGGDYTIDNIVGADHVERNGGKVLVIPFLEGYSTTAIEQKIRSQKD